MSFLDLIQPLKSCAYIWDRNDSAPGKCLWTSCNPTAHEAVLNALSASGVNISSSGCSSWRRRRECIIFSVPNDVRPYWRSLKWEELNGSSFPCNAALVAIEVYLRRKIDASFLIVIPMPMGRTSLLSFGMPTMTLSLSREKIEFGALPSIIRDTILTKYSANWFSSGAVELPFPMRGRKWSNLNLSRPGLFSFALLNIIWRNAAGVMLRSADMFDGTIFLDSSGTGATGAGCFVWSFWMMSLSTCKRSLLWLISLTILPISMVIVRGLI